MHIKYKWPRIILPNNYIWKIFFKYLQTYFTHPTTNNVNPQYRLKQWTIPPQNSHILYKIFFDENTSNIIKVNENTIMSYPTHKITR